MALKELNISEDEFWNMTPIKYAALVEALGELNSVDESTNHKNKSKTQSNLTTIDKIPGW